MWEWTEAGTMNLDTTRDRYWQGRKGEGEPTRQIVRHGRTFRVYTAAGKAMWVTSPEWAADTLARAKTLAEAL